MYPDGPDTPRASGQPEGEPPALGPAVREALLDLQRYLSDGLAPLMVADSVTRLLGYPPALIAAEIRAWVGAQEVGGRTNVPVSDYLFHAMQKLHAMGEFDLVPKALLSRQLSALAPAVLELCPEGDRELLLDSLRRLGKGDSLLAAPVTYVRRQVGSGAPLAAEAYAPRSAPPLRRDVQGPPATASSEAIARDVSRNLRRFSLLLDRLSERAALLDETAGPLAQRRVLGSQLVTTAAASATSSDDLSRLLSRLSGVGVGVGDDELFRTLGASLPGWVRPDGSAPPADSETLSPAEAIRRVILLSEDPAEAARRIHSLVHAAVEQLDQGSLPRAVTMLDLAGRTREEKKVDGALFEPIRRSAEKSLDLETLRRFAEEPARHPLLRKVLAFFPSTSVAGLLDQLETEEKRDRRRLVLSLLEAHGPLAREEALERLQASIQGGSGDEEWHVQRNLLYLLRRVSRPADAPVDDEIACLLALSEPSRRAPVVKEALACLGQIRHERAEQALCERVKRLEELLLARGAAPFDAAELVPLLDRAVGSLARMGTPGARRAVVDHAFKTRPELGDTLSRLVELGSQDLSSDPAMVERLAKRLRTSLPFKVLGLVLKKDESAAEKLVAALAGTPTPPVRDLFHEIVDRFGGHEFARAAARSLAVLDAASSAEPAASLTGDLETFGLPDLLQSLSASDATGVLTLKDRRGEPAGRLLLDAGKLRGCQTGRLRGEAAFFQLFERPVTGTFAYTRQALPPAGPDDEARAFLPLVLEGMRRYDELVRSRGLVPDDAVLAPAGPKPTPHDQESDPLLLKAVWEAAASGLPAAGCETRVSVDSFRVRRLLSHWVEEGSLAFRPRSD